MSKIVLIVPNSEAEPKTLGKVPVQLCIKTGKSSTENLDDELCNALDSYPAAVFLIHVHCTFHDGEKELHPSDSGGIVLYRRLLRILEKKSPQERTELKVAFYSPVRREVICARRPQDEVLLLLPFIDHNGDAQKFITALEQELGRGSWPQLNIASLNLLTGYGMAKVEGKISCDSLLLIDDEADTWCPVISKLIDGCLYTVPPSELNDLIHESAEPGMKNHLSKLKGLMAHAELVPVVLCDFYLTESHLPTQRLSFKELADKSGAKMYKKLRQLDKALPIVMHTSSNKARYYKFFDAAGADGWLVKDTRYDATPDDCKEAYCEMKTALERFTVTSRAEYFHSMRIWGRIQEMLSRSASQKAISPFWLTDKAHCALVSATLNDCWLLLRRYLNRDAEYETEFGTAEDCKSNATASAIISGLYSILEYARENRTTNQTVNTGANASWRHSYLHIVRNVTVHAAAPVSLDDALLYFCVLLDILSEAQSFGDIWKQDHYFLIGEIINKPRPTRSFKDHLIVVYALMQHQKLLKNSSSTFLEFAPELLTEALNHQKNETDLARLEDLEENYSREEQKCVHWLTLDQAYSSGNPIALPLNPRFTNEYEIVFSTNRMQNESNQDYTNRLQGLINADPPMCKKIKSPIKCYDPFVSQLRGKDSVLRLLDNIIKQKKTVAAPVVASPVATTP